MKAVNSRRHGLHGFGHGNTVAYVAQLKQNVRKQLEVEAGPSQTSRLSSRSCCFIHSRWRVSGSLEGEVRAVIFLIVCPGGGPFI